MSGRYDFTFGGRERQQLLASWIGEGKRVLDVGARDGVMTSAFTLRNDVVACDMDVHALRHGILATRLGKVVHADARSPLPFASEAFDCVFCGEVLEHTPLPAQTVREIARVLCAGGLFVGSVPNAFRLKNRLMFLVGQEFETEPTHLHHFSPVAVRSMLGASFDAIEMTAGVGRFVALHPMLFGNVLMWKCRKA